jgi:citrate synthase
MIEYIPGLAGVPATESSISSIDGKNGILAYRGYSIEDLVKYASIGNNFGQCTLCIS